VCLHICLVLSQGSNLVMTLVIADSPQPLNGCMVVAVAVCVWYRVCHLHTALPANCWQGLAKSAATLKHSTLIDVVSFSQSCLEVARMWQPCRTFC